MVDKTTNDIVKQNLPKIVADEIRLERPKVQNDIAAMIGDAIKKERESIRAELSTQITNVVANIVPLHVYSFLQNYMSNHILHVHPSESTSLSILNLQHQLYLKMKDDEQARDANLAIWLSLKIKFKKHVPLVEPYRLTIVRTLDHEYHHDDDTHPEGETKELEDFDAWKDDQGIDDDEVPYEEVSLELLDDVLGKGMTTDDLQRMQDAPNDMMRNRCKSLSEAWTSFKDLFQKVPHHGIDLWLQVQILYDHVHPITRRTIDQATGGKLRDKNDVES
ncbi:hypothetical protein Tco_1212903 [Tanacetum coccineum]